MRVREEALAVLRASDAILPRRELARVVNEVSDEVVGFGPIEFLLKDPEVTEVLPSNGSRKQSPRLPGGSDDGTYPMRLR